MLHELTYMKSLEYYVMSISTVLYVCYYNVTPERNAKKQYENSKLTEIYNIWKYILN